MLFGYTCQTVALTNRLFLLCLRKLLIYRQGLGKGLNIRFKGLLSPPKYRTQIFKRFCSYVIVIILNNLNFAWRCKTLEVTRRKVFLQPNIECHVNTFKANLTLSAFFLSYTIAKEVSTSDFYWS